MTPDSFAPIVPAGYSLRCAVSADAPAVATLKSAVQLARHGTSDVTIDEVVEEWARPRLVLCDDVWVLESDAGDLAGYGYAWPENPPGEYVADQTVHPGHRGRGLSALLLDLAEARAFERAPTGTAVTMGVWTHESDRERATLFTTRGYTHVRTFRRLQVGLLEPPSAPRWPAGIQARPFRRGRDEVQVHAAVSEAFQDHWRPEAMDLDEWLTFRFAGTDPDPDLWWVAWDGEHVAGSVLAVTTPLGGYVDDLAVRRPWRGRGLGRALLLQVFGELRARGVEQVYLGVDADNPTGAVGLYESLGMRPVRGAHLVFERVLPTRS